MGATVSLSARVFLYCGFRTLSIVLESVRVMPRFETPAYVDADLDADPAADLNAPFRVNPCHSSVT